MLTAFKKFTMRGNVIDMAVGIIIGAAFGQIVNSLVNDVIMPPIGLLLGNADFSNLFIVLKEGSTVAAPYSSVAVAKAAGAVTLNFGQFINTIINFIILAFSVFMVVNSTNKLAASNTKETAPAPATTTECPYCASMISIKAKRCPNCTSTLSE